MDDVLEEVQKLLSEKNPEEAAHLCFAQAQSPSDRTAARAYVAKGVELLEYVPTAKREKLLTWRHTPTRIFVSDWRVPEPDEEVLGRLDFAEFLLEQCLLVERKFPHSVISGTTDALARAYWWNGECYLRISNLEEAAKRKGKALRLISQLGKDQQRGFSSEFEEEYNFKWRGLVPAEMASVSEQYLLDLRSLMQTAALSRDCRKQVLTAMAFINDLKYWLQLSGTTTDEQESVASEARYRLTCGQSKDEVLLALVERILHGAPLRPSHTHYMEINEVREADIFAKARHQLLHTSSLLDPEQWDEAISKWHHVLGKAQLPSYHELIIQRDDLRNLGRRYLMRQILTTRVNNWQTFHQKRLATLSLSQDEVERMLARTEKAKKSEIEGMFDDLPDCDSRVHAALMIEEKEEEFRRFNDWSLKLSQSLQALWRQHGGGLGGVHFLLAVDESGVAELQKISAADLFQTRPREEAERLLHERLEKIIKELASDPILQEQIGGAAIWVQLTA